MWYSGIHAVDHAWDIKLTENYLVAKLTHIAIGNFLAMDSLL
jgi:hypothetical protein